MAIINVYVSAPLSSPKKLKSTATPLAAQASWVSAAFSADGYLEITGSIYTDVTGTMYVEQSEDKVNWDISSEYTVPPTDGKGFIEKLILPYVRVRYLNGGSPQTTFRLAFDIK